jgi:protein transport protein DSL1/ZW10
VVNNLRAHAALAQDSSDANVAYDVLAHLLRCWTAYRSVTSLIDAGKLPDAVSESGRLEELLQNPPEPLAQASVTADLKVCVFSISSFRGSAPIESSSA